MDDLERYLRRADELVELANHAATEDQKRKLMDIAAGWRALALQRNIYLKRIGSWPKVIH